MMINQSGDQNEATHSGYLIALRAVVKTYETGAGAFTALDGGF